MNFEFHNPTRLVFGAGVLARLGELVWVHGKRALLVTGGGSVKRSGVFGRAVASLKAAGVSMVECAGVEPNPRISSVVRGAQLARSEGCDVVIGLGGGSTMDAAKVMAAAVFHEGDPWDMIYHGQANLHVPTRALPIVTVPTLAATGSEMNNGAVITDEKTTVKSFVIADCLYPRTALVDPELTLSVPRDQTAFGVCDLITHVTEGYFNGVDGTPLQDRFAEGVILTALEWGPKAVADGADVEARAQVQWASVVALNGWVQVGTGAGYPVHMIEHVLALGTLAAADLRGVASALAAPQGGSQVFFTREITAAGLVKAYSMVSQGVTGRAAIKLHTGEPNGPNILPREMVRALQQSIPNSALVETNTPYKGKRSTTADHRETLKTNGWDFCPVDIMDEDGAVMIPVRGGKRFTEMSVGKHMLDYDSMVVLTHFKGHAMGGFGGSMKNIAIGCPDGAVGKKMVHAAPDNEDYSSWLNGEPFQENMVESAKAVVDHFGKRIVFINVLRNMSVDCDCAGVRAAPPKARDLGILASTDILAVDQASIDMVYALPEEELHDLKERIESRKGLRQLSYMKEMGMGNDRYELVEL